MQKPTNQRQVNTGTGSKGLIFFSLQEPPILECSTLQTRWARRRVDFNKIRKTSNPETNLGLILLRERCSGIVQVSSVQPLSRVQHFMTPWTAAHQASLSITNSQNLVKLMSIESLMWSNHLILCRLLLLLPSTFPSIRVSSNKLALCIRWPKY